MDLEQRGDGVVHAEELVILPDDFHQPDLCSETLLRGTFHRVVERDSG